MNAPRLVIGGTGSGCGKTTMTCALLQAFVDRGFDTAAFKCGPDYIDPMFHSRIIGTRSRNLDAFLCGQHRIPTLLAKNAGDISIIEGVMGYYDGQGTSSEYSTAHIAAITQSPSILVVNARGMSLSLAAILHGFVTFQPNTIRGVLLNGISPRMTDYYAQLVEHHTGLQVYGALPRDESCAIESRHLGLVTAFEIEDLKQKTKRLAQHASAGIDLDGVFALANTAPALPDAAPPAPAVQCGNGLRIALARDEAFCFDYADSLDVLTQMGAELVPFSPLRDAHLPRSVDGLLLCGGYPELYAEQLGANRTLLDEIKQVIGSGMPTIAECGGFLLLHDSLNGVPMAGVCGGKAEMTKKLQPFGYIAITAQTDNLLCAAGETLNAHEFHYAHSSDMGSSFVAAKRNKSWNCVHASRTLYAGYPHFHFAGQPDAAQRFLTACQTYRKEKEI